MPASSNTPARTPSTATKLAPASRLAAIAQTLLSLIALCGFAGCVVLLTGALIYDVAGSFGYIRNAWRPGLFYSGGLALFNFITWSVILRVLFTRGELPVGVMVTQENGRHLWTHVRTICAAANIRPPDHIVLMPDLNAFAAEVPTRGIFRRKERVLGLGYPLLAVLSVEQGCAVITHELKHLDANHGSSSLWHGMVASLLNCFLWIEGTSWIGKLFCLPIRGHHWLFNRLSAYASRLHEFEADQLAGELFGEQNAADALIALTTLGEEFQAAILRPLIAAWERGDPMPASILGAVVDSIHSSACRETLQKRLEHSLAQTTGRYNSHPCLADRIDMLGAKATLPAFNNALTAAKGLLWTDDEKLRNAIDQRLRMAFGDSFEDRHKTVEEVESILRRTFPVVERGTATREQAEIVSLMMETRLSPNLTRERHETIVANYGDIPSSICELAFRKLREKDLTGAEDLLNVYEAHPLMSGEAQKFLMHIAAHSNEWSFDDLWLKNWAEAPTTRQRINDAISTAMQQIREFNSLGDAQIPLMPHGLDGWHVEFVMQEINRLFDASQIFLARKTTRGFPTPIFQMLILTRSPLSGLPAEVSARCCLPGLLKFTVAQPHSTLGANDRNLRNYAPALIYSKSVSQKQRLAA